MDGALTVDGVKSGGIMSELIPKHGGYRKLKSFQVAQLVYDLTVRFCDRYIDKFSRTRDQMVQAARSGVQNIAEGSQASATSKKTELKPSHPTLMRFKERKPQTVEAFADWVEEERKGTTDRQGRTPITRDCRNNDSFVPVGEGPCESLSSACLAANGALSQLNLACYFLDRQVERLAQDFKKKGGFTERLYKVRTSKRRNAP